MRQPTRQAPGAPLAKPTDPAAPHAAASPNAPRPALPGSGPSVTPPLAGLPQAAITFLAYGPGLTVAGVPVAASDACGPHQASAR